MITTHRTMCPMNCHPTLCGMKVTLRDGALERVEGDPDNPDSRGFLCIRGQASREVIGNPARLLRPLVRDRRDQPFRQASWDEAFERIVASIRAAPPSATAIWPGHGTFTTNYGTRISAQLMARFAALHGSQFFSPTMICWGLGAFGLGLTGVLETHSMDDLGDNAQLVILWGANLASQPNTAPRLLAAKARGARIVTIDVRHTEAAAKSDEVYLIRPGTDTALALAMMQVICSEGLHDPAFVERNTVGFDALAQQVRAYTPQWASTLTGLSVDRIVELARLYASVRPAMILLGGSSMHKGANGWQAGRAIACLPALTGNLGVPGAGFGPRHGSGAHGRGLASVIPPSVMPHEERIPNQMSAFSKALRDGRIGTLMLLGTNMLSSFADSQAVEQGLERTGTVVSFDLFLNDTAIRHADVVLPATAWLEELGAKMTQTHLYLMDRIIDPPGETRSLYRFITELAARLELDGFHPWASEEAMVDAILDHRCTGHATVAALREEGSIRALDISPFAYPTLQFDTPSGKVEFFSARAAEFGLPPLPVFESVAGDDHGDDSNWPLTLTQGRTLAHFHGFYNNGRELPTLARREPEPLAWLSPEDAAARGVVDGGPIRLFNPRGEFLARARVTERIPPGVVWIRDGWPGLNRLTGGSAVLPDAAVDLFAFSAGQASFDARIEVAAIGPGAG